MSGIYIPDIEVPTKCPCKLIGGGYSVYCYAVYGIPARAREYDECCENGTKPSWCPILPSTDVAPVVHAHWIGDTCSACGKRWNEDMTANADDWGYFDPMPPYCNNCGAKMDE